MYCVGQPLSTGRSVISRLGGSAEDVGNTRDKTKILPRPPANDQSSMLERMQQMAQLWGFNSAEGIM